MSTLPQRHPPTTMTTTPPTNDVGASGVNESRTVAVKLVTSLPPKYRVADTVISVPTSLKRFGLSGVVNHLLDKDDQKSQPFVFLINGEYVRGSLQEFMESRGLNAESTLEIDYGIALPPPQPLDGYQHDDWIAACSGRVDGRIFLSGCYDSNVRVWTPSGDCIATLKGHTDAVKAVTWLAGGANVKAGAPPAMCVTGAEDGELRTWLLGNDPADIDEEEALKGICRGHTKRVSAVCSDPSMERLCSAAWDNTIRMWNLTDPSEGSQRKKRKTTSKQTPVYEAYTLGELNKPISCLTWTSDSTLYSGGWDHCVRQWDVTTGVNVKTMTGQKVINDMAFGKPVGLLLTADADGYVRGWDSRSSEGSVIKMKLTGHKTWVSSISWGPASSNYFVSGSQDTTLKVWDVRSSAPIHTVSSHSDKVLAVDWCEAGIIASGGADNMLHLSELTL